MPKNNDVEIAFEIKYMHKHKDAKVYSFTYMSDWMTQLSNWQIKKRIREFIEKKRGVVVDSMACSPNSPHIKVITNIDERSYIIYHKIN